jgi:hypothetical protein
MKKPTGDGFCPPEVKRAKHIDRRINGKVTTRPLDDSDISGGTGHSSDDSVEVLDTKRIRHAVVRRAPTPPLRRNSRLNAPELVNKVAQAFDPEAQQALQDDRSQWSFQSTQLLAMTQELRDTQATSERLHNQLAEVGCARDRAELKLEMYGSAPFTVFGESKKVTQAQYITDEYPDLIRQGGKIHCETLYPEGGGCVEWITDDDNNNKENWNPSSSSSGHPSLPPSDFSTSFEFNGSSGAGVNGGGGGSSSGGSSSGSQSSSSAAHPGSLSPEI